jgi:phosphocarrier protein
MIEKTLQIPNLLGLHARAAAKLVHTASRFKSKIRIIRDSQIVDAKSILNVLMLAAGQGVELRFVFEGPDESLAADEVTALVVNGFGENEESEGRPQP